MSIHEETKNLVEEGVAKHFNMFIDNHENTIAYHAILRFIGHEKWPYVSSVGTTLGIDERTVNSVLESLQELQLVNIREDGPGVGITEDGKMYVGKRMQQEFGCLPSWKNLNRNEMTTIYHAVEPFMSFVYTKEFDVDLETLRPLKEMITQRVQDLRRKENEYFARQLCLPEGSNVGFSFVSDKDPTWVDGGGRRDPQTITARMNYSSIEEALLNDVDRIDGTLQLEQQFMIHDRAVTYFPVHFNATRNGDKYSGDLNSMLGLGSEVWRRPVQYQQCGFARMKELRAATEKLVPDKQHG